MASVARRYAQALSEVAAESSALDSVAGELDALVAAIDGSPEFREVLSNPALTREQRHASFESAAKLLNLSTPVRNVSLLLLDRNRAELLPDIARFFRELTDEKAGRARAEVSSAVALSPEIQAQLGKALSAAVKKQVTIHASVDPSLLGGAVAKVGSFLFDGSVKGQLQNLRRELKQQS